MYSSAKAFKVVKFGLTQKGGTMGQKFQISQPTKCKNYIYSSTIEDPLNSFTYK